MTTRRPALAQMLRDASTTSVARGHPGGSRADSPRVWAVAGAAGRFGTAAARKAARQVRVAQIFNLLYRRIASCEVSTDRETPVNSGVPPITNRGYGRVQLCATTAARRSTGGFTLIELLLAVAIFATVVTAINAVFFSSLRLRAATTRVVEDSIPINHALTVLKSDLRSVLAPGGKLAGTFTGGIQSSMFNNTVLNQGGIDASTGLQFCTSSGITDDSNAILFNQVQPWPELQKVSYYLRTPLYSTNQWGKELVRSVTRNLLSLVEDMPVEQPLLDGVERIEILFYDGLSWLTTWDPATQQTSLQQTDSQSQTNATLPQAVKILIEFAAVDRDERWRKPPILLVVPLATEARTNQVASASTNSQTQNASTGGNTSGGGNQNTGGGNQNAGRGNQSTGRGGSATPTPPASNPSTGGQRGGGGGGGGRGGGR